MFNSTDYMILENIAVFDDLPVEGKCPGFTSEELQAICDKNNERYADTGDATPLVLGHTMDVSETEQPPIVGYATNFYVGEIGLLNPRKAIYATFNVLKQYAEVVKQYPRRSIELFKNKIIDPIALLSASAPAKYLGLLSFSQNGESVTKYFSEDNMELTEILNQLMPLLEQTDVYQFVRSKMASDACPKCGDKEDDDTAAPDEPAVMEEDDEEKKEEPSPDKEEEKEKEEFAVDESATKFAAYETAIAQLTQRVRQHDREKMLLSLGVEIDVDEELKFSEDFDDDKFNVHLTRIKKNYSRPPVGIKFNVAKNKPDVSEELIAQAVKLATEKKIDFKAALNLVQG